jgi:hypothetical protein
MDGSDFLNLSVEELGALLTKQAAIPIQNLTKKEHLEAVGKLLPSYQILALIAQCPENQLKEKISPILVGMSQEKFEELLLNSSDKQIEFLKLEGFSEALLHHLTLLIHRLEEERSAIFDTLNSIESAIQAFDPELMSKETVDTILQNLNAVREKIDSSLKKVKKAMGVVWSTSNVELIDKLNKVNISLMRMRDQSDLQALLNQKLFSIYKGLKDDDSAIDGLANFSVWYLEDYTDVGLLPSNSRLTREALFQEAKERLQQLNLCTIKDLKDAVIFSRQTLKEFIKLKETSDFSRG